MKIAIFGLGYIGIVSGACLANQGHTVCGVDVHPSKVQLINEGQAPVVEPGIQELVADAVEAGSLSATTEPAEAIASAEVVIVCVGTPPCSDGSPDLQYLHTVLRQIGEKLHAAAAFPVVTIRSTVPPGTLTHSIKILEAASGLIAGNDFGVAVNPEFLREGSALSDFMNPPYTLVGTTHARAAEKLKHLYSFINAPFQHIAPGPAELIKYVNNSFHALKITFANEVGTVCKSLGVDSHEVMELVCSDTKLNISPAYLLPGLAYGGSCLPKDLKAFNKMAEDAGYILPVLNSIAQSNQAHMEQAVRIISQAGRKRLGFLGISFKAQTDDLRESPTVRIVEMLLQHDYEIRIYDHNVNLARLIGSNRDYIEEHISHLKEFLVTSGEELVDFAETIVVTNNDNHYREVLAQTNGRHSLVDLVRYPGASDSQAGDYHGICW